MTESSQSSFQDDPGPGSSDAGGETKDGIVKPTSPEPAESSGAMKKEKGRVRFNSNAAAVNPPATSPPAAGDPSPERDVLLPKPRPSAMRTNSSGSITAVPEHVVTDPEKTVSAAEAQERARQVAAKVRRDSDSRGSFESIAAITTGNSSEVDFYAQDIPLQSLGGTGTTNGVQDDDAPQGLRAEAYDIVRAHTQRFERKAGDSPTTSETSPDKEPPSEVSNGLYDGVYDVPAPTQYRGSVLSQLLKLYKPPEFSRGHSRNSSAGGQSTTGSESCTPTPARKKWYEQNRSQETLSNLIEASARLANPNETVNRKDAGKKRPVHKRAGSNSRLGQHWQREEIRITVHIAETLARQDYIIKLCRALMLFGAPTHRLEEYLSMTARVLEIDGQFLYLPGCMIISFDDRSTHTTEVRIVRSVQGIDLGRLKDAHHVYKEVMHDVIGVEEGTEKLDTLMAAKERFNAWFRVFIFGMTSATAAPFSFQARLIDLPLCFLFGALVGLLQLIVAPKSKLYNNVFEVSATVIVSFLARAFGSIRGGSLFCFSSIAQGGIVMLLPGYSVLCSSLELQSRAMVPGSIRMVYAIIYCLLLGFGITVGALLYGLFDHNATSETSCADPIPSFYGFIFVPFFNICICILYQARWSQMPAMIIISFAGYIVNFFSSLRFAASPQIANTLGALCVGVLANLYSRIGHGVAAATLIPAIFTQVPGGLASTGGLLSGLSTANLLTNSTHSVNGTNTVQFQQGEPINTLVFNVAASMIQIAIGIAVGLFLSALIVYPLGKRRSGLFSF